MGVPYRTGFHEGTQKVNYAAELVKREGEEKSEEEYFSVSKVFGREANIRKVKDQNVSDYKEHEFGTEKG